VRPATPTDVPALVAFGEELRDLVIAPGAEVGRSRGGSPATARADLEQRYCEALADPSRHLVVVVDEGDQPLGMALLVVAPANALVDIPAVHMSPAVVGDRHKRRGAGRALVCAARGVRRAARHRAARRLGAPRLARRQPLLRPLGLRPAGGAAHGSGGAPCAAPRPGREPSGRRPRRAPPRTRRRAGDAPRDDAAARPADADPAT
jgi:hypothetical protein